MVVVIKKPRPPEEKDDDDSVQEEWKEKFKERGVKKPPEETQTIGEAYISRGKSRGGITSKDSITPTTSQEFQASILEKQGKEVTVSKERITAVDPRTQRKTTITKYGDIVTTPTSATVGSVSQIRQVAEQRGIEQLRKEKERAEEIREQAKGKGRPAEEAARIISTSKQRPKDFTTWSKTQQEEWTLKNEMSSGAEALFLKRKTELLTKAGEEARLAHYPQYSVGEDRPIGRQEYGTDLAVLKGKSFIDTLKEKASKTSLYIKEKAERFSPFLKPEARIEYTEDGKPILTTKFQQASFLDVDKMIIPKSIQEYTTRRKEHFESLPDSSFKQTFTSPRTFAYEVTKSFARPIAGFAEEFTKSPVKTSLYTYGAFRILGALPKTKIIKYGLSATYVGGKVVASPKKFTRPSSYLETSAELGIWKLAFKAGEKFKGSKALIKTATYKQPVQEKLKVAPVGKKGTIKTIGIKPSIDYTVQGKRVTPIQYAKILESQGKLKLKSPLALEQNAQGVLRLETGKKPIIEIARTGIITKFKGGKDLATMFETKTIQRTKGEMSISLAHELIHYKTPRPILKYGSVLPYEYQPGEALAFGLEKTYAEKGFKVTSKEISGYLSKNIHKVTLRKDKPLEFKYPREQLLKKALGKNVPVVSVSKGYVTRAGELSTVRTVTVGRKVYGSIIGKREDIIFMKGKKGGLLTKTLAKEKLDTKFVSQLKAEAYSKLPATVRGKDFKPSLVKGTKTIPYKKETLKFKYKDRLSALKPSKKYLDIGVKKDDTTSYYLRNIERTRAFETFASSKGFKGTREITKTFSGKAISKLTQTDVASPKTITTKYGKDLIIEKFIPDIKYAYQPSYKPSTKTYTQFTTKEGVIPISRSVKMPKLLTSRKTGFVSESTYIVEKTSPKPFKRILTDLPKIGKKGQLGITRGTTLLETKMPTPERFKPDERIPISGEELFAISSKPISRGVYPISFTEKKIEDKADYFIKKSELSFKGISKEKPKTYFKEITTPEMKYISKLETFSEIKVNVRTPTKTPTRSMTRIKVLTEIKVPTITPTKTPTKSISKTVTRITTLTRTTTKVPLTFDRAFQRIGLPKSPFTPPPPPPKPTQYKKESYGLQKAFKVFLGSGKKEIQIGRGLTRGAALKLGSFKALHNIKATFRIQEAGTTTKKEKKFKVSEKYFREYRIKQGKRIQTPNIFIQKRGTRLTTQSERREIQSLKKLKTIKVKQYAL